MKKKICCIFNYPSHYREEIYKKIEDEFNVDFYFGTIPKSTIKKIDFNKLSNFKKELKTIFYKNIIWYRETINLLKKPYSIYILTGDPQILSNWFILLVARFSKKKVYLWSHGFYGNEKGIKKIIKKLFFKMSHKVILYGDYAKNLMIKEGFKKEKLITIFNSLNYDHQIHIRQKLIKSNLYENYFNNHHPTLLYIGRVQKSKKLEMIIDAMEVLKKKSVHVNFIVIGKQETDYKLEEYISSKNLVKNVWLYGPSYNEEEIGNLIYNADLCVSPGNVGLTAIHSLMYGTPVITHNNFQNQMPEFEVIKEGVNGGFFIENDVKDLAIKIQQIIELNISSEACYKEIDEKWNPNNQINILKDIFK